MVCNGRRTRHVASLCPPKAQKRNINQNFTLIFIIKEMKGPDSKHFTKQIFNLGEPVKDEDLQGLHCLHLFRVRNEKPLNIVAKINVWIKQVSFSVLMNGIWWQMGGHQQRVISLFYNRLAWEMFRKWRQSNRSQTLALKYWKTFWLRYKNY